MHGLTLRTANGVEISGYAAGQRKSPIGIGGAIAVHAVAIGLFLLIPKEITDEVNPWKPIVGTNIPNEPDPPEQEIEKQDVKPTLTPIVRPTRTDPVVPLPGGGEIDPGRVSETGGGEAFTGGGTIVVPPPTLPDPVFVDARIDPRALSAFQPDYPGAMIRQSMEGSVTVRVTIGADGRVVAIEKISATDEAFWLATQRHAMRKWRFRPSTRDGVPIVSTKQLTVHFKLEDR